MRLCRVQARATVAARTTYFVWCGGLWKQALTTCSKNVLNFVRPWSLCQHRTKIKYIFEFGARRVLYIRTSSLRPCSLSPQACAAASTESARCPPGSAWPHGEASCRTPGRYRSSGDLALALRYKIPRRRGPAAISRSRRDTTLHGAEPPWPSRARAEIQNCTAPRPRGHLALASGYNIARRRGPVAISRSRRDTNLHGAEAPCTGTTRNHSGTVGSFVRNATTITRNHAEPSTEPRTLWGSSKRNAKSELPALPFLKLKKSSSGHGWGLTGGEGAPSTVAIL